MSKKETRRAARETFPKAKPPAPKPGAKYAPRTTGAKYTSKNQKQRARTVSRSQGLRKPSWKRACIYGVVLAVAYFVMMYWIWPSDNAKATVWGALLFSAVGFVAFTFIVYFTDRFTYQRKLRKLQGGSGQHFGK